MNEYSNAFQQNNARLLEKSTPRHHGSLRSQWNIDNKQQLDLWLRTSAGFERLDAPYTTTVRVPGYATLDLRYAYRVDKNLEIALIGRNLVGRPAFRIRLGLSGDGQHGHAAVLDVDLALDVLSPTWRAPHSIDSSATPCWRPASRWPCRPPLAKSRPNRN